MSHILCVTTRLTDISVKKSYYITHLHRKTELNQRQQISSKVK